MIGKIATFSFAALLGMSASVNAAGLIDFETVPGDVPSEGLGITNQYEPGFGVTFSLSNSNNAKLAEKGDPLAAFVGHDGSADANDTLKPVDAIEPGNDFFLTDDSVGLNTTVPNLIITYTTPVSGASAAVLDIDAPGDGGSAADNDPTTYEEWTVQSFDALDNLLDTVILSAQTGAAGFGKVQSNGNGRSTFFAFSEASDIIAKLTLTYTGTRTQGVGLAFDHFNTASSQIIVPLPGAFSMGMVGISGLAMMRRRRSA